MENGEIIVRIATPQDAEELLTIYAPYVKKTAISFDYEVPTVAEFAEKIRHTLMRYPYLTAVKDGRILGYIYVSSFKDRPAYDWAVETSIYIRENCRKMGLGRILHEAMENVLREQGILNMEACIAFPEEEDERLTLNSVQFHAHLGYRMVGRFYQCGCKFGQWYDMVWMEKLIGEHVENQPPVKPFDTVRAVIAEKYGYR